MRRIAKIILSVMIAFAATISMLPLSQTQVYAESSDWSKLTRKECLTELRALMKRTTSLENGTAGSSLKLMALTADYMRWGLRAPITAVNGADRAEIGKTAIRKAVRTYMEGLSEKKKAAFVENMGSVKALYDQLTEDPDGNLDRLLDAGVSGDVLTGKPVIAFEMAAHQAGVVDETDRTEQLFRDILDCMIDSEDEEICAAGAASKLADWGMVSIASKRQIWKAFQNFTSELDEEETNLYKEVMLKPAVETYQAFLVKENTNDNWNLLNEAGITGTGFPYNYNEIPRVSWLIEVLE